MKVMVIKELTNKSQILDYKRIKKELDKSNNFQAWSEFKFKEEPGYSPVDFYKNIYTEENLKKMGLNERQIKAVMYVKEKKIITLSDFKNVVSGVTEKTLYRDLQELVNKGILKEIGEKKGRKYELL